MNIITKGDIVSGATFSPCEQYRYSLWRRWPNPLLSCDTETPVRMIAFCGLNPSVADHKQADPTVTRCINRAKEMGMDGMYMLNLFAWRDTDPKGMKAAIEPVGIENDETIRSIAMQCQMVIACWGAHGKYRDRASKVLHLLRDIDLYCLKTTKGGMPQHPLYLKSELQPKIFQVAQP